MSEDYQNRVVHSVQWRFDPITGEPLSAALVPLTQRPAAQTEREAFEEWYAEDANKQTGKPGWFTPKSIAELRDGDGYGEHRVMLNGKWEGWQARASLPAPQQATPERHLTVTTNQQGEAVMVSWQDDEHRILEVVWERKQATPEPVGEVKAIARVPSGVPGFMADVLGAVLDQSKVKVGDKLYTHPAPGVPEGFALVPVEPTLEIIQAICHAKNQTRRGLSAVMTDSELSSIYHAMLAAAQAKGGAA